MSTEASTATFAHEWTALLAGEAGRPMVRDAFLATGPDATSFLHGQLSQDVVAMELHQTRRSLLLQPNGRVIAVLRLTRIGDDQFLIDTDAGAGDGARAALARFLIRTKCELGPVFALVGVRVPQQLLASAPPGSIHVNYQLEAAPFVGIDLLSTDTDSSGPFELDGVSIVSAETGAAWAIAHGEAVAGVDLTESTLPAETGLIAATVKFGKGCYVGQELVERIDSRGRVVRVLARLTSDEPMHTGVTVIHDGVEVGTVGSAAPTPTGFAAIALLRAGVVPDHGGVPTAVSIVSTSRDAGVQQSVDAGIQQSASVVGGLV
jgi:tRNA-modifying protein YgfZ